MNLIKQIELKLGKNYPSHYLHRHNNIFVHFLSDRNYSDSFSSNNSKCKTIHEVCDKKPCNIPVCPQKLKVGCNLDKVKCSDRKNKEKEAPIDTILPVDEKIDYTTLKCPPLKLKTPGPCPTIQISKELEKIQEEDQVLLQSRLLPKPPSKPVVLCPCAPPPKLPPGDCPCPPEIQSRIPPMRKKLMCKLYNKELQLHQKNKLM